MVTRSGQRAVFLMLGAGVLMGLAVKLFAVDILLVSGQSMAPCINDGERIFVSKLRYGIALPFSPELLVQWAQPRKGDIVIYFYNNKTVVKRCVAVEGGTLDYAKETRAQEFAPQALYRISVDGSFFLITESQYQQFKNTDTVPAGMIFAVGDNASESVDSRHYGFVSVRNILGKVLCR
jgi:signal peptidase I